MAGHDGSQLVPHAKRTLEALVEGFIRRDRHDCDGALDDLDEDLLRRVHECDAGLVEIVGDPGFKGGVQQDTLLGILAVELSKPVLRHVTPWAADTTMIVTRARRCADA